MRLDEESGKRAMFDGLLASLDRAERGGEEARMSFRLLFEYGDDLGWDLPAPVQWEKACRGADARDFPWGVGADDALSVVERPPEEGPSSVRLVAQSRDRSPHGITGLGGNASEWVFLDSDDSGERMLHFLKGGHFSSSVKYASASYFLGVAPGNARAWTGIRVIREVKPFLRHRYEKRRRG